MIIRGYFFAKRAAPADRPAKHLIRIGLLAESVAPQLLHATLLRDSCGACDIILGMFEKLEIF
jgi:hypothetical protein